MSILAENTYYPQDVKELEGVFFIRSVRQNSKKVGLGSLDKDLLSQFRFCYRLILLLWHCWNGFSDGHQSNPEGLRLILLKEVIKYLEFYLDYLYL